MKKALVLLSGGLDSTTALYVAKEQGFNELYAITFEYGQKHDKGIKRQKLRGKSARLKEHKFIENHAESMGWLFPHHGREDGHSR